MKKMSHTQRKLIPSYIFLSIMSLLAVFPLFWMITAATNTSLEVARGKIWFGTHFLENYRSLMSQQNLWQSMGNSFFYSAAQTVGSLLICSLAGYGFEIYHDRYKDRLFGILLLAMMVPQVATLIPLFTLISRMKLLNTVWAFIIPALSTPFMIMMFRQNSRTFPVDVLEAARIDGLSEIGIFARMYMPIMKSTYAAAAVITFMNSWNSYMWPRTVLKSNSVRTMPMLIANMSNGYAVDYGVLMFGVVCCSLPTMILFFVMQKQFADGITGSVK